MTKKEEIQARRKTIVDLLKSSGGITKESLMEKLDVEQRTVEGDLKTLKKEGYVILEKKEKGESKKFFIEEAGTVEDTVKVSNGTDVQEALMLMHIEQLPVSKLKINKKIIDERIDELINLSMLKKDKKGKFVLGESAPIRLILEEYDENASYQTAIKDLLDVLCDYDTGESDVIKNIKQKIDQEMVSDTSSFINNDYISMGRYFEEQKAIDDMKRIMLPHPYRTKALRVTYTSARNGEKVADIKVGMILFSKETDQSYLICEMADNSDSVISIIISSITGIEALDVTNDVYDSEKYRQIYREMFVANANEPVDVKVKIHDKFGRLEKDYGRIVEGRSKTAKLTKLEEHELLYEDTVRGELDLANYLRKNGSFIEVVEPASLRDNMIKSAQRVLQRYKEEGLWNE